MAIIEIRHPSGKSEKKKISRKSPFSIGSHSANDFTIEDEDLSPIHCRISWNKTNYEVTSASEDLVKVNGSKVKHTLLRSDDTIKIGGYEFQFKRGKPRKKKPSDAGKKEVKPSTVDLKPISQEEDIFTRTESADRPDQSKKKKPDKSTEVPDDAPEDLGSLLSDIIGDEIADQKKLEKEPGNEDMVLPRLSTGGTKPKKKSSNEESLLEGIQSRIQTRAVRPGEQEMLRSPLILSLGLGSVVLILVSLTFWFIIGRNTSDAHYQKAADFRSENKYVQAIETFESFITGFPGDERVDQARLEAGQCRIEKEINGSIPDWENGVSALDLFIKNNRDVPGYDSQKEELEGHANNIAFGAAATAEKFKDPKYLDYSVAAQKIAFKFIQDKTARADFNLRLAKEHKKAEDAILKKNIFEEHLKLMSDSLEQNKTLDAIHTWELLLRRYPIFLKNRKVAEFKQKILKTETAAVTRDEKKVAAIKAERATTLPVPITLSVHRRSRTAARTENRVVVSLAKDCCIGIDTITGKPKWRRVIGMDSPFFPMASDSSNSRIIMFDTRWNELIHIEKKTGKLIWRQPISSSVPGEPLIHEGQIYLSTTDNKLFQIDVESGEILSVLNFSQTIHGPPVLDVSKEKMILAGDSSFIYTLSIRPLKCEMVSYTGQQNGSIKTPLLRMGALILVIENTAANQSLLRVFDTRKPEGLVQIASSGIPGEVLLRPVLRGSKLFITSTGQRISAFNVSDDPNQKTIVSLSQTKIRGAADVPLHLIAGADDEFWMASDALREFRLKSDTIQIDEKKVAIGISTQPIQVLGESFYVGRRPFYSQSTLFAEVDRETMTEKWQLTLGASILNHVTASGQNFLLCGTENGDFYNIQEKALAQPGFRISPTSQLKIPRNLRKNIHIEVLQSQKIAVYIDGPKPHIWILTPTGQIEKELSLKSAIQAPPLEVGKGILLPIAGRIQFWGSNNVKDYVAVFKQKEKVTWKSLTSAGNSQLIALDSENNLHRIGLQDGPPASLQKISQITLENHVDLPLASHESDLILVNSANELIRFNNSSLEKLESHPLSGKETLHFWKMGNRLVLETRSDDKHFLETWSFSGEGLKQEWSSELPAGELAGKPLVFQKSLILAHTSGLISQLSLKDHQTNKLGMVGQPLSCSPSLIGNNIVVCTIDGSLQVINSFLKAEK